MAKKENSTTFDPEIAAINAVVTAIHDLDAPAQQRVIRYVVQRFKLQLPIIEPSETPSKMLPQGEPQINPEPNSTTEAPAAPEVDGLEGINSVARKWMSRNGLTPDGLSKLFSLGIDEIDLVAKKKMVPGRSKKDRMRNVILLKGVASYLGGGAARITHEQAKETCVHYDACDTINFSTYLKQMTAEVGGTKETGYTLTARGLTAATELVKEMLNPEGKPA